MSTSAVKSETTLKICEMESQHKDVAKKEWPLCGGREDRLTKEDEGDRHQQHG